MFDNFIKKIKCISRCKLIGTLLIVAGVVLLMCFLPGWAWGAILGVALIACGIYMITL